MSGRPSRIGNGPKVRLFSRDAARWDLGPRPSRSLRAVAHRHHQGEEPEFSLTLEARCRPEAITIEPLQSRQVTCEGDTPQMLAPNIRRTFTWRLSLRCSGRTSLNMGPPSHAASEGDWN